MTSETSARETPATRATSSIVGARPPGPLLEPGLTAMRSGSILPNRLERFNFLERSNGRGSHGGTNTADAPRRRPDLVGRVRGTRLGEPAGARAGARRDGAARPARDRARAGRLPAHRDGRPARHAGPPRAAPRRRL